MSTLGVVGDFSIGLQSTPLWDGPVLNLGLGQCSLYTEGLVGRHGGEVDESTTCVRTWNLIVFLVFSYLI